MATVSFFQNVVVEDEDKINEVREAINGNTRPRTEIKKIDADEEKQREIAEKWYSHLKK